MSRPWAGFWLENIIDLWYSIVMSVEVPLVKANDGVAENPVDIETIDRAVAVLEISEQIGIPLRAADVAVHNGMQEATWRHHVGEAIRSHAPESLKRRGHFLTISEKIGRVALAMHEDDRPPATDRFGRDKSFWEAMKVGNAWQAYLFNKKHFVHSEFDLHSRDVPVEMDWLRARDADVFAGLQQMQQNRRGLRLRELTKTPDAVLDSANRIAEDTQKTFVHTWLPQFLHDGLKPIMTDEERELHDYDSELGAIDAFRQRALRVETDDELSKGEQATLDRANQLLADELAGEYVLQRLLHDHAARESEGLRQMLPVLVALSGAAWGVEKFAPNDVIRAFAKVAGSGDDIAAEVMSLPRLKLSKEKLRTRLHWFVPLAIGMVTADALVDRVDSSVNPNLGGAMYGATTVGLSAASSLASLREHRSRYRELVAEGKVRSEDAVKPGKAAREHYVYNDPLRRGMVAGILAGPAVCAALWPWVEDKPYIYVPLGAIEPIAAAISTKYDERRLPHRLKKFTRDQLALAVEQLA